MSDPQAKSPSLAVLCDDDGARSTINSSDFDLRALQPDPRLNSLLQFSNSEDLDRFNLEARQNNRHPELFALYPPTDEVRWEITLLTCLNHRHACAIISSSISKQMSVFFTLRHSHAFCSQGPLLSVNQFYGPPLSTYLQLDERNPTPHILGFFIFLFFTFYSKFPIDTIY